MNIRFYNAKILSMKENMDIIEGEVWVEGSRISHVGSLKESQSKRENEITPVWEREIDVKGNLLMPGFKDAHTHSAMTFLRSYADDLPLQDWLNRQVFPMEAKLLPEDIYWLVKLAILEYLTSGITAAFDMYCCPEMTAKASVECGFRTVLVGCVNNFTSSLEKMEQEYQRFQEKNALIRYCLGFHAEYTCSKELLEGVARLAHQYQAPVFAHISETADEVQQCIRRYGKTPPALLDSLGMFDYGGGGYHCIHMTEEDFDIFEKRGLYAVTNPASNMKLASGIANISEMLRRGICVAIGTDGAASNNCLDMFREMFLVTGLAKLREQDAAALPADMVLRMAAQNGAKAMGLYEADCLSEGKLADLIMLDLHQPNMQPLNHIVKNIVYSGSKQNVKLTMINGRILYEDGSFFVGEEPEEIYRHANAVIARMTAPAAGRTE